MEDREHDLIPIDWMRSGWFDVRSIV